MLELIFFGRGGQGAITASKILADAAFHSGHYPEVSAIPSFGTERRGAPVQAFCRIADHPIWTRTHIKQADYAIILDETVLNATVIPRIKSQGILIVNTWKCPADVRSEYGLHVKPLTIITADLTQIATELKLMTTENQPIVNTSVIGVLIKARLQFTLPDVHEALEHTFGSGKKTERNFHAVQLAAERAVVETFS